MYKRWRWRWIRCAIIKDAVVAADVAGYATSRDAATSYAPDLESAGDGSLCSVMRWLFADYQVLIGVDDVRDYP
jgi:hypothetical protein